MTPPRAKKVPRRITKHGDTRVDEYAWLRDKDDPAVIAHLEAENAYADAMLAGVEPLRQRLYKEFVGRLQETDLGVPVQRGEYFYYHRFQKGKQYTIHCRKRGSLRAREEVVLDENAFARGKKYFQIETLSISPNHRFLAYTEDVKGDEVHTLRIKDLATGRVLADATPRVRSVAWGADSRTLLYTVIDDAHRPHQVWRHRVGAADERELVYDEPDAAFYVHAGTTDSKRFLVIHASSKTTSEVHILPSDDPWSRPRVVEPRRKNVLYSVAHHGEHLYVVTNHRAINFKLVRAPLVSPGRRHWEDVIPHRPLVKLDSIHLFEEWMAIFERRGGFTRVRVRDMKLKGGGTHDVEFPEPVYTVVAGPNPEFTSRKLRLEYTSLVTPREVLDYHMRTRRKTVLKRAKVRGGYTPSRYGSERIAARAPDGTLVPISLVYRKDLHELGRPGPLLLSGYGSYGRASDPYFSSVRLSLLDRGFTVGIAHVRGGGEMGRPWYYGGKLLAKKHTFTDFIACAEHLVRRRITTSRQLVAMGGSAGGLLMGAIANLRPDLFHGIVAAVPFVDVLNTMLDPSLPLTVLEYDEWGNPNTPRHYRYIKSYAPYENVRPHEYPHILATAGLHDPRVGFWEPAKWVQRIRDRRSDGGNGQLCLMHTKMSGHFGASGRYSYLEEIAREYAFILHIVGGVR